MFRIKPVDTLFTHRYEYLYVDVETDRTPITVDVFVDDRTTPETTATINLNMVRWLVFDLSRVASDPTNQIHRIKFVVRETGETSIVDIAYMSSLGYSVEFYPYRGVFTNRRSTTISVSYTHLTLPTKRIV